jgi:acetyl-CoA C-acetyltransferase
MTLRPAYIIAARRTALGRLGGLHRARRVEDLATPPLVAALKDAGVNPTRVDRVIVGNSTAGGNPARLIALTAGLPDTVPAVTIDQQCGSGLEAILSAVRCIAVGDADVVVAGGAEAISMAPWRIAKPRGVHQTPRFIGLSEPQSDQSESPLAVENGEALAERLKVSRIAQDEYALRSHMKASRAQDERRFLREIVALKTTAEESRDQSATLPDADDLADMASFVPDGTLSPGNVSALHDGAAFLVIVSATVWECLGRPPALTLGASASIGVAPDEEIEAPIVAFRQLVARSKRLSPNDLKLVEMSEQSAIQAIALRTTLRIADEALNPDGGAIARGHPLGAAGAVLVVRLFTRMVRMRDEFSPRQGVAVLGASGGQGVAALFNAA